MSRTMELEAVYGGRGDSGGRTAGPGGSVAERDGKDKVEGAKWGQGET